MAATTVYALSCGSRKDATDDTQAPTDTFHGWETTKVVNSYSGIDVATALGGNIIGYQLGGQEMLWQNPLHEGDLAYFTSEDIGGAYRNAGGSKTWPAPQSVWGGPPDKVLCGASWEMETDSTGISVISPADTEPGRTGLQYAHRYVLKPQSTIVELSLSQKNVSSEQHSWAIRHVVTVPADTTSTLVVPVVRENDWNVISGEPEKAQWHGVKDGLFTTTYTGQAATIGMKVNEGWAAWHNAQTNKVFAILFPVVSQGSYPDDGFQVKMNSLGMMKQSEQEGGDASSVELEVVGPLATLAPGDTSSFHVTWAACSASGVVRVLPFGVISEQFTTSYDLKKSNKVGIRVVVTGKLGSFMSGDLVVRTLDTTGKQLSRESIDTITPLAEVIIAREVLVPPGAVSISFELWTMDHRTIGVFVSLPVK